MKNFALEININKYFDMTQKEIELEATRQLVKYSRKEGKNLIEMLSIEGKISMDKLKQLLYLIDNPEASPQPNDMVSEMINGNIMVFKPAKL